MELVSIPLDKKQLADIKKRYGDYLKLTVDLEEEKLILGTELHTDGERFLLKSGSQQDNIWGGGINLKEKLIDTAAILNLRPSLGNDSLEILDPKRRKRFITVVRKIFAILWK